MSVTAEQIETRATAPEQGIYPRWPRLFLPQIATLEETQFSTDIFFKDHGDAKVVDIDMRDVTDVSILTLAEVMSLMIARKKMGKETLFTPPLDQAARDTLHQWEFPRAIWTSVGPITHYLSGKDGDFLEEKQEALSRLPRSLFTKGRFAGEQSEAFRTLVHKFLAFRKVAADEIPGEINYWSSILDEILLSDRLHESEKYFGSRVVYEALMGVLVNGKRIWPEGVRGTGAQVASRFSDPEHVSSNGSRERNFVWLSWDQGESIISKVKRSRSKEFLRIVPQERTTYLVTTKDSKGSVIQRYTEISSAESPGKTSDYDALVQWLSLQRLSKNSDEPSLGMYMLINAVCDMYGGEVIVRTDKYRMNIRNRPEELKISNELAYDVTITKSAPNTPAFVGNMIAVRLPLKPQ